MTKVMWLLAALTVCVSAPQAWAGLGEKSGATLNDAAAMRGTLHIREFNGSYTSHDIQAGNVEIHEYVDSQGTVFAVTWHGGQVNLGQLLASYFPAFHTAQTAFARRPGGRKRLEVTDGDLVVVRTGNMRTLGGVAYVRSLLPRGVTVGSLP